MPLVSCLNRPRGWAGDALAAMNRLHIDCPTGLAGDMLLAAFLDLGVPRSVIETPLATLGLHDRYRLDVEEARSGGLRGKRLRVTATESAPQHRHWAEIRRAISDAALAPRLRERVLAVFTALAEAEATVHGVAADAVHFHEVGAIDALVDVVGVCSAVDHLSPVEISCASPPAGSGSVSTAHGQLPVPVPAVLELSRRFSIPLLRSDASPEGELTTPTGLALVATLANRSEAPQSLLPQSIGIGLGHRVLDRPNLLRVIQMSRAEDLDLGPRLQTIVVQEAWIDDASAEDLAALITALRGADAVDVAVQPLQMKKDRPGWMVSALVEPERASALRAVWFDVSSTIGLRERQQTRWLLPRRRGVLTSGFGAIRAKQVHRPNGHCTLKPEADDLQRLSHETGRSIAELRELVRDAVFEPSEPWSW